MWDPFATEDAKTPRPFTEMFRFNASPHDDRGPPKFEPIVVNSMVINRIKQSTQNTAGINFGPPHGSGHLNLTSLVYLSWIGAQNAGSLLFYEADSSINRSNRSSCLQIALYRGWNEKMNHIPSLEAICCQAIDNQLQPTTELIQLLSSVSASHGSASFDAILQKYVL
jgi:hypothetical protein